MSYYGLNKIKKLEVKLTSIVCPFKGFISMKVKAIKTQEVCKLDLKVKVILMETLHFRNCIYSKSWSLFSQIQSHVAQDLKLQLLDRLSKVKYFSHQSDGGTDSGNTKEELFFIQ